MEYDQFVHTVNELGAEHTLYLIHHAALHFRVVKRLIGIGAKPHGLAADNALSAGVARHDDNAILKAGHAPHVIRQPSVLQDLQQHVKNIRVRLFDLIKQHNAVRLAADGFSQLAALLKADITGRRAHHARGSVFFHVFAHIQADQRIFIAEHRLAQGAAQLRLADASRSQEDEGANRPFRVLKSRARAADGAAD